MIGFMSPVVSARPVRLSSPISSSLRHLQLEAVDCVLETRCELSLFFRID
jgi:hypothetical protein